MTPHRVPGNRAACRDCKQTVQWVTMTYGKARMIDIEPSAFGDVAVIRDVELAGRKTYLAVRITDDAQQAAYRAAGGRLYRFHLATCPERRDRLESAR